MNTRSRRTINSDDDFLKQLSVQLVAERLPSAGTKRWPVLPELRGNRSP